MNTLISGPPCSGKTTWAEAQAAQHGGQVMDWDRTWTEVTGLPPHTNGSHPDMRPRMVLEVEDTFRYQVAQAIEQGIPIWLIRTAPAKRTRGMLRRMYQAQGVVLATPPAECIRRLQATRPPEVWKATTDAIHRWWYEFQPGTHEVVITTTQPGLASADSTTHPEQG